VRRRREKPALDFSHLQPDFERVWARVRRYAHSKRILWASMAAAILVVTFGPLISGAFRARGKSASDIAEVKTAPRAPATLDELVRTLRDGRHAPDRQQAAVALAPFLTKAPGADSAQLALSALTAALIDPHAGVRAAAADGFGMAGPAARPAVSALIDASGDGDGIVRVAALEALAKITSGAKVPREVKTAIGEALDDPDDYVRKAAFNLFTSLGRSDREFVAELVESRNDRRRRGVLWALTFDAQLAREVWPDLEAALNHQDAETRARAALAVASAAAGWDKEVPSELIRNLNDDDIAVRRHAAFALGFFGARAERFIPLLMSAMRSADANVKSAAEVSKRAIEEACQWDRGNLASSAGRRSAIDAPEKSRPGPTLTLRGLIHCLHDPDAAVRLVAVGDLANMGEVARPALEDLDDLAVSDPDPEVRQAAEEAIRALGQPK
jgi:HEAT repeat protein